ncbi:chromosomal replication initiator DnaA [Alkalicaulis satelles]|uniref:Chromosomal replication initiator DnaA n=1 Tax=Alkalicaulis satelles TaxID=2609175 RepID=A0A5M6ZIC3_9PROT|nr:helix-turn-helix domain-containing protein [Alkalicaulis satelles]KAA5804519.1 chromosomal replication initiator DnaA [Alkalicaulis satelles]
MPAHTRALDLARARLAQQAVSYAFDIAVDEMTSPTRGSARAALARQIAIYLTHVAFEISLARTAEAFGRDRSTAAHACHKVEDRRDDPAFDHCLDELEACLRSVPPPSPARLGQAA